MGRYKDKISKTGISAKYVDLAEEFMKNKMGDHSSDLTHKEIHKLAGYFQQIFEEGVEQKRREIVERALDAMGLST